MRPDLSALADVAKGQLQDRAAREISERLFGKQRGDGEAPAEDESGEPRPSDREAAEGAIREGLGRLLGD